jgi:hypothetical protein
MTQAALFAAQMVQQQARTIGTLPVLGPLIQGVNLRETVNRYVPSQASGTRAGG